MAGTLERLLHRERFQKLHCSTVREPGGVEADPRKFLADDHARSRTTSLTRVARVPAPPR